MDIDIPAIENFLAVIESGSFTKAAERMGRTQSGISQQIAKLEASLGKQLLVRGRSVSLTPEGEVFLGYARQIIALCREAVERFQAPELGGEVRFGISEDFASVFLSGALGEFSRIHPRIALNVTCDLTMRLFDLFRQGGLDLVLVKMSKPDAVSHGAELWSESLEWVGNVTALDPQRPLPLVLSPEPCVYRTQALLVLNQAQIPWRLAFSSPSYSGTVGAVRAGMGITVLPRSIVPPDLNILRTDRLPSLGPIHVSVLKNRPDDPSVNALETFIVRRFSPHGTF